MYSFAQRDDTEVVDEPLYGHYLKVTGFKHPGREEVLSSQENEGRKVIEQVFRKSGNFNWHQWGTVSPKAGQSIGIR